MQKSIMIEFMNDNGEWAWYAVIRDATPLEGLAYYAKDNGVTNLTTQEGDDGFLYLVEADVRAYGIDIITLKK